MFTCIDVWALLKASCCLSLVTHRERAGCCRQTETGVPISWQLQRDLGLLDPLQGWSEREVEVFEAVLTRDGKDMDLIASQLAPGKSVGDVVRFFYCAWKARRLPQARLWYEHRARVRPPG